MTTERYQGTHPHVVKACEGTKVNPREAASNPTLMRLNSSLGQAETHHVNGSSDAAKQVLESCRPIVDELRAVAEAGADAFDDVEDRIGVGGSLPKPYRMDRESFHAICQNGAAVGDALDPVRKEGESDPDTIKRIVAEMGQIKALLEPFRDGDRELNLVETTKNLIAESKDLDEVFARLKNGQPNTTMPDALDDLLIERDELKAKLAAHPAELPDAEPTEELPPDDEDDPADSTLADPPRRKGKGKG